MWEGSARATCRMLTETISGNADRMDTRDSNGMPGGLKMSVRGDLRGKRGGRKREEGTKRDSIHIGSSLTEAR